VLKTQICLTRPQCVNTVCEENKKLFNARFMMLTAVLLKINYFGNVYIYIARF